MPCGDQFKTCKFIRDAYEAVDSREEIQQKVEEINKELGFMNKATIDSNIKKYNEILTKKFEVIQTIDQTTIWQERLNREIERKQKEADLLEAQLKEYEENKEAINNITLSISNRGIFMDERTIKERELNSLNIEILNIAKR